MRWVARGQALPNIKIQPMTSHLPLLLVSPPGGLTSTSRRGTLYWYEMMYTLSPDDEDYLPSPAYEHHPPSSAYDEHNLPSRTDKDEHHLSLIITHGGPHNSTLLQCGKQANGNTHEPTRGTLFLKLKFVPLPDFVLLFLKTIAEMAGTH